MINQNKKMNLREKDRHGKITIAILLLIAIIGVGYAALGANLKINGVANIPSASWDVHFKTGSINVTEGSVTIDTENNEQAATITNATQVNYAVKLALPGDFYEFTVKAENTGSIGAMIDSVVSKMGEAVITTGTLPSYIDYSVTYSDGTAIAPHHLLAASSEEEYKVRIAYKTDIEASELPTTAETLNLNFQINYVQADSDAVARSTPITIISGTRGNLQPGDVIGIGDTEDFYVLSSDNSPNGKTILLAKYNLLVGNYSFFGIYVNHAYDSSTSGYGLQSEEATGYIADRDGYYNNGTVPFSSITYWDDGEGNLLSPYNENGASYNGNPYPYVYDSNSNLYQYISGQNGYVSKLIGMGAPSTITGRLLTYEEAVQGLNINDENTEESILKGQSYWLGSGKSSDDVYFIEISSFWEGIDYSINYNKYDEYDHCGVRPVIEIYTADI